MIYIFVIFLLVASSSCETCYYTLSDCNELCTDKASICLEHHSKIYCCINWLEHIPSPKSECHPPGVGMMSIPEEKFYRINLTVSEILDRVRNSLWGAFIGDALSMPVHGYNEVGDIRRDFGYLEYYADPKSEHPDSDMKLDHLIGSHILFNKIPVYQKEKPHYHDGLQAGDITLNAEIDKLTLDVINQGKEKKQSYNADAFLEAYITFLTTPGTHNDSYLDSYHRYFVENFFNGFSLKECAGQETIGCADIAAAKLAIPVLFSPLIDYLRESKVSLDSKIRLPMRIFDKSIELAAEHIALHFRGVKVQHYARSYLKTLLKVVLGKDLRKAIKEDGCAEFDWDVQSWHEEGFGDNQIGGIKFDTQAEMDQALPIVYFLSFRYSEDFDRAIIVDCNLGGENTGRSSAIGALVAAHLHNLTEESRWICGLKKEDELARSINEFVKI